MSKRSIQQDTRKSAYVDLIAGNDFVEICLWSNGEGFDVSYGKRGYANFTWEEFEAIKKLVHHLDGKEYEDRALEKIRTILEKYDEGEIDF